MHPRAAMCSTAPDLTPCRGGLQCCHMSYSSEPLLPIEAGSDATMCPAAPHLASLLRWAMVLPHVL
jgi:hypothetical protein